jgi:YVTN family beta-propeller protein
MPWGLAVGADNLLYVANFDSDTVTVHDPISGARTNTVTLSGRPSMALSHNGRIWVTRQEGATGLVSISAGGAIVTSTAGVPAGATYMAADGRSGLLYVSHPGLGRIYVVDTNLSQVTAAFVAPGAPFALTINTATDQLYAVDAARSVLYVLDLATGAFLGQMSVGLQTVENGGQGLALLNGRLYVANDFERTVTVYRAASCSN